MAAVAIICAMVSGCEALAGFAGGGATDGAEQPLDLRWELQEAGQPDDSEKVSEGLGPSDATTEPEDTSDADVGSPLDSVAPVDAPPPGACVGANKSELTVGPAMVLCALPSPGVAQCAAAAVCNNNNGWHLCSGSEYLARGGSTRSPGQAAWLGGCVSQGALAALPWFNGSCASCSSAKVAARALGWHCQTSGALFTVGFRDVGLSSNGSCARVGVNAGATAGYWMPRPSYIRLQYVLCCQ